MSCTGSLEDGRWGAHSTMQAEPGTGCIFSRKQGGLGPQQQFWAQLGSLVFRKVQNSHRAVSQQPPALRLHSTPSEALQCMSFLLPTKQRTFIYYG